MTEPEMPSAALAIDPASPDTRAEQLTYSLTDPDQVIELGEDTQVTDNHPSPLTTTYRQFFERLSAPDLSSNSKDGRGYLQGPCRGTRAKANMPIYHIAILDADSTMLPDGSAIDGAPGPDVVHAALCKMGLTHHIYTTFSNGAKGHRYRIVFPCTMTCAAHLRGFIMYVVDQLQGAGIPMYLTPESMRWGMRWHYPRLPSLDTAFFHATYFGYTLDPAFPSIWYAQGDAQGNDLHTALPDLNNPGQGQKGTPIGQFCELFPLPALLASYGYQYCGQGMISTGAMETPVMRYRAPGSSSQPGVVVLQIDGRWRAYSHHANDPLANGYMNDSHDVATMYGLFQGGGRSAMLEIMAEEKARRMEEEYPMVMEAGSKFKIAKRMESELGGEAYNFMQFEDFKNWMADDGGVFIEENNADIKGLKCYHTAEWWRSFQGKTKYADVRFIPTPFGEEPKRAIPMADGNNIFNLFLGWGFKPNQTADYGLIDWHVKNVLCGGHERDYNYLLDWIAHILQFPKDKSGVAVVMRGDKGTGKSIFWSSFVRKIGSLGVVIPNSKLLTGAFNSHLSQRILGLVEESFWAGNPSDEGILKTMITDSEGMTEKKGVDAKPSLSYMRFVLSTNNEWAVPASEDERRYFVPEISRAGIEADQQSGNYFSNLALQLSGAGMDAFLTHVSKRQINTNAVRRAPAGSGLQKQKLLSLTGHRAWVFDFLSRGYVAGVGQRTVLEHFPRETVVDFDVLEESSKSYLGRHAENRSQIANVMNILHDYFGDSVRLTDSAGIRCVVFPSIEALRTSFSKKVGNPDFDWDLLQ